MEKSKDFKTVLITGASSGIGSALATELAPACEKLILVARRLSELQALQKKLAPLCQVEVHVCDLLVPAERKSMVAKHAGKVDVLVNNAGQGHFGQFLQQTDREIQDSISLNCLVLTELSRDFGQSMAQQKKGLIVNIASLSGFLSVPYFAVYAATKAYVVSLSESLDAEFSAQGVRVLCVAPGGISTNFHLQAGLPNDLVIKYGNFMMTPEKLAPKIAGAMRARRALLIPGLSNELTRWLTRLLPRRTLTLSAKRMYEPFLNPKNHSTAKDRQ